MRTALILAREHGKKHLYVVSDPGVGIVEQRLVWKTFRCMKEHTKFERVEYWVSDAGCVSYHKMRPPVVCTEPAKKRPAAAPKSSNSVSS